MDLIFSSFFYFPLHKSEKIFLQNKAWSVLVFNSPWVLVGMVLFCVGTFQDPILITETEE